MQSYTSHAKVNLGLQVLNKRDDGYHNLHSLFVELDLADELIFVPSSNYYLTTDCSDLPVDESNLITKAYRLIKSQTKNVLTEFAIHVKKKIPIGGGLGGGSSNSATTLKVLNNLWNVNLSLDKLEKNAAKLGADVPFFIRGGIQLIEGIGDKLTAQDKTPFNGLFFLLVIPPIYISTAWAYRNLNKTLQPEKTRPKFAPISMPMNWELYKNDFEGIVRITYPKIGHIKATLQKSGALYAGLSGSGSAVFGVFDSLQKIKSILGDFPQYQTILSYPVI